MPNEALPPVFRGVMADGLQCSGETLMRSRHVGLKPESGTVLHAGSVEIAAFGQKISVPDARNRVGWIAADGLPICLAGRGEKACLMGQHSEFGECGRVLWI